MESELPPLKPGDRMPGRRARREFAALICGWLESAKRSPRPPLPPLLELAGARRRLPAEMLDELLELRRAGGALVGAEGSGPSQGG